MHLFELLMMKKKKMRRLSFRKFAFGVLAVMVMIILSDSFAAAFSYNPFQFGWKMINKFSEKEANKSEKPIIVPRKLEKYIDKNRQYLVDLANDTINNYAAEVVNDILRKYVRTAATAAAAVATEEQTTSGLVDLVANQTAVSMNMSSLSGNKDDDEEFSKTTSKQSAFYILRKLDLYVQSSKAIFAIFVAILCIVIALIAILPLLFITDNSERQMVKYIKKLKKRKRKRKTHRGEST